MEKKLSLGFRSDYAGCSQGSIILNTFFLQISIMCLFLPKLPILSLFYLEDTNSQISCTVEQRQRPVGKTWSGLSLKKGKERKKGEREVLSLGRKAIHTGALLDISLNGGGEVASLGLFAPKQAEIIFNTKISKAKHLQMGGIGWGWMVLSF